MRRAVAVLAALLLSACGEEPSVQTLHTTTAYQHVPSGMVFPTEVGSFVRTNVYPGRAGSERIIVAYASKAPSGPLPIVRVTLDASPMLTQEAAAIDPACRTLFQERKADIAKSNAQLTWREERDTSITVMGKSQPAMLTSFDYDFQTHPVRGFLILACRVGGGWTLEYRATTARDPTAGQTLAEFMARLPAPPQGAVGESDRQSRSP